MKISLQYSVKNKPPTLLKQLRFAILSKLNFKNSKNYYTQSSLFLKLSVFTFILLIFTEGVQAQQEGQQTLFMFNTVAINPAVAGSRDIPTMTLTTRNQWVGFKGAPIQQNMSFHTPFLSKRLGMSMTLGNRSIGIFRSQTTSLALSYSPVKTENFQIRFGLQGSARRLAFSFEDNDQAQTVSNERNSRANLRPRLLGNFGMGMFMAYKDCFFGISVPYAYSNILGVNEETPTTAIALPHYYITGGLTLPLVDNITIKTSGIIKKVDHAPWGVEVNGSLMFYEKVTAGLSYRAGKTNLEDIGESVDFLIYYQLSPKFGIGGAYDYNLSPLKKYTDGSFEFVLRYDFKQTELRFSNPRVFF